jgi:glycosyltransferase involved in cell wall biosynthesis
LVEECRVKRKIAFVKSGSFSHINESVRLQLKKRFPDNEVVVRDVRDIVRGSVAALARCFASAVAAYGLPRLVRRGDPLDCLIQSPGGFAVIRDRMRREVTVSDFAFTFQTQSMWDASVPDVPHFVYTDNTELAPLQSASFDRSDLLGDWWLPFERQIYRHAARVFTMSSNVSRSLLSDYGVDKSAARCVFAGSNATVAAESAAGPERHNRRAILFVGVEWERKGGPELVQAFGSLLRKHPDATLTIAGCRPSVQLPNCRVLGRVPLNEVPALYDAASVFCLPTRNEPFGIAFVEAMHHGLPLVGTDIGAIPDFIIPEENGLLVPVRDPDALMRALDRLLAAPEERKRMGARSALLAQERYTWERVGERLFSEIAAAIRE